jgi:SAM-dependent methyltransferase
VHPTPLPESLAAYYRDASADQNSRVCWEGSQRHAHSAWRRALTDVRRLAGDGPLLDVGCGAGQFLAFARAAGHRELAGLELSQSAAARARETSGATVREEGLLEATLPSGRFAAVTFWDVLEHLAEPRRALARAFELLRPGGVVVSGTPHRDGLTLRLLGARALMVMPPEHLFLPTARGLRLAVCAQGFQVERVEASEIHLREWTHVARTLASRILPRQAPRGLASESEARRGYLRIYHRTTALPLFERAQSAANAVLRRARLGDVLVLVARRPPGPAVFRP